MSKVRKSAGRLTVVAALLLAAAFVAACGDDDEASTPETRTEAAPESGAGTSAYTPVPASEVAKAGEEAGAAEKGSKTPPDDIVVGILEYVRGTESNDRGVAGVKAAADAMGWKTIAVNSAGAPPKMQAGLASLINQGADAIVLEAIPSAPIRQALATAKQRGIPVISINTKTLPAPGLLAQYGQDEAAMSAALANKMVEDLGSGAEVALYTYPLIAGIKLAEETTTSVLEKGGIEIVDKHESDLAEYAPDTTRATTAFLTQHPNLKGLWSGLNIAAPVVGPVLKARNKCGEVKLYMLDDLSVNLDQIRKGCLTAVTANQRDADAWAAIDRLAAYFANGKAADEIPVDWAGLDEIYGIRFRDPAKILIVDKSNVPSGDAATPRYDAPTFFKAKWAAQYGSN